MSDRNLVTYEEPRNPHGPFWRLLIDRSSAGQPGLFLTIQCQTGAEADRHIEALNREMTVVVEDGNALLAPVLVWLGQTQAPVTVAEVEAAAEALWKRQALGTYQPQYPYLGLAQEGRERLRVDARAALEAARAAS